MYFVSSLTMYSKEFDVHNGTNGRNCKLWHTVVYLQLGHYSTALYRTGQDGKKEYSTVLYCKEKLRHLDVCSS